MVIYNMSAIEDVAFSRILQISADDRLSASETSSNFTVDIGQASNINRILRCVLVSCIMPNLAYNIRADINDIFSFRENGQAITNIQIPEGFWNASSLCTYLQTEIGNALTVGTVAVLQDPHNLKISFVFTGITAIIYGLPESTSASNIGITLGSSGQYVASFTCEQAPQLQGLTEFFIQSSALAPGNLIEQKSIIRNVFNAIPMTAPFGGINIFQCNDGELCSINYPTPRDLRFIDIGITDRRGNYLDLQGHNVKLVFKVYY